MDKDLKYRHRLSSTIDKGLYKSFYNYAFRTRIPISRLLDEAIEDFLNKNEVEYELASSWRGEMK